MPTAPKRWPLVAALLLVSLLPACTDIPEECGQNVDRVTELSFSGPSTIGSADRDYESYAVTASIQKVDDSAAARVCFAVRDDDPATKLFWAVDDVLDAGIVPFDSTTTSRTVEDYILLENRDDEVCGFGALPGAARVRGCSGEDEAEVYLQPIGSDGVESSRKQVRIE